QHIEGFVTNRLEHEVGKRTINKCLTLLMSLLKYAAKHDWIHTNPAQHVKKLKTRDDDADPRDEMEETILTPSEFQQVLKQAAPEWSLIIKAAGLTGLRQGELIGLRWRNVDLKQGKIYVREQFTSGRWSTLKTKASRRTVPISIELITDFSKHMLASRWNEPDDLVFATSAGTPQNRSNLRSRGWKSALRRAGLRERPFHSLRHSFVSGLIANNINMKVIQSLCGHSSISTTMDIYGHLLPNATDGVAETLAATMLGNGGSKTVAAATAEPTGNMAG
ncbi:MAG: site-specific integrase, partial [Proteobacteria bacterium]|nr:site-specific integrase [Pseudomonadota bacterium]